MKKYMQILLLVLFSLLSQRCDSTEPKPDVHPNITWKIYNIGTNDSNIRDIFVIDKENIWAVGQMRDENTYTYDSLGNWINPYNVAVWNGEKWDLKTVYFEGSFGEYQSIWAFNKNDIWFGATSAYVHWDGNDYKYYNVPDIQGPETRIWGSSNNILYLADYIGTIVSFDGTSWENQIKYVAKNIRDLYGVNGSDVLFASYADYYEPNNKIYKMVGKKITI